MTTSRPEVPIEVDSRTGTWLTDGMPMIYLPRHFYVNHHLALEAAFGRDALARVLYDAGHLSAWQWCEKESATHGLSGVAVFRHYMARLSQRGWGRFRIDAIDEHTGSAGVRLDHSIYVHHHGEKTGRRLCYPFAGWFPGSLEWCGRSLGREWQLDAVEEHCASEAGHESCFFRVSPRTAAAPLGSRRRSALI